VANASGPPKGYNVVTAGLFDAPNGQQSLGSASCPSPTVLLGGGAVVLASSLAANINSSWPQSDTQWSVWVNNNSGLDTSFYVYAICANQPKDYAVVQSATTDNAPNTTSEVYQACTKPAKPLGGGVYSTSAELDTNLAASAPGYTTAKPKTYGWIGMEANNTGADFSMVTYVICGKVKGYVVTGTAADNPSGTETGLSAACPSPKVPLGGGPFSNNFEDTVTVNSTYPFTGNAWTSYVNNASPDDNEAFDYAVCGGT